METTRPNKINDHGDFIKICLYNKNHRVIGRTIIDKDDYEKVRPYRVHLSGNGYAQVVINGKSTLLHHLILGRKDGFETDHRNQNTLDNRKQNLRFVTHQENLMNKKVKGFSWNGQIKKWDVRIMKNRKQIFIGYFKKMKDAKAARAEAVEKYFGQFAYTN